MSVRHRFPEIILACAIVGACTASSGGFEVAGPEAKLQYEQRKFLLVLAGAGRGPFLQEGGKKDLIEISYLNAGVRKAFFDALDSRAISENIGKIPFCECKGLFIEEGQKQGRFKIDSFTIHFEEHTP